MNPSDFVKNFIIKKDVQDFLKADAKPGQSLNLYESRGQNVQGAAKLAPQVDTSSRAVPVGTIHGDRQKVSMNPPKWVHVSTGHSFDSHDTHPTEHHKLEDHEQVGQVFKQTIDKMSKILNSDDIEKGEKLLRDWLGESVKSKNFFALANAESKRMGGGIPRELQNKTFASSDKAKNHKEKFSTFLKEAKARARDSKNG
jgi:hypothetical protein